ncbi:transposase [Rhodococcus oxybenzonivorans]|nr:MULTISPECIES: transposase [Rhodococcus]MDV7246308.1 transposase [Rhodococcus oxybenzonivorans]MDV7337410.1 transposase [Rhodococcus oxybenzonivorans]MDV8031718.1 transposase [Rhodococcus sp. IEGM 27]
MGYSNKQMSQAPVGTRRKWAADRALRPPMRSPGRPEPSRAVQRDFWRDCRHVTRRLESDLLRRGHAVVRVKTQLMALHRRSARQPGKSDPIDAHAVAMAALREENLPIAQLDEPTREVKLLSDHRRNLICERTKLINRLRWHLHELDPELVIPVRGIRRYCVMDELAERLTAFTGVVAQIARDFSTGAGS